MTRNDAIGDRMKRYEAVSAGLLTPNTPVFVRVDGRAFHTLTRDCDKPFDTSFIEAMTHAAEQVAAEMSGFVLGYVQSDEATFLLRDDLRPETQGWFGYEVNKLVSLSAALMTAHFNAVSGLPMAVFDSRAFNVPAVDAPNVFVWRQKDWARNWPHMLARAHFSAKQLHGVGRIEALTMLDQAGVNIGAVPESIRYGTFLNKDGSREHVYLDYETLSSRITPDAV